MMADLQSAPQPDQSLRPLLAELAPRLGVPVARKHRYDNYVKQARQCLAAATTVATVSELAPLLREVAIRCRSEKRFYRFCKNYLPQLLNAEGVGLECHIRDLTRIIQTRQESFDHRSWRRFASEDLSLYHRALNELGRERVFQVLRGAHSAADYREKNEHIRALLRGRDLEVDRRVREQFLRAGLTGSDFVRTVEEGLIAGRNPLTLLQSNQLVQILQVARAAGVAGEGFQRFFLKVVPTLGAAVRKTAFPFIIGLLRKAADFDLVDSPRTKMPTSNAKHSEVTPSFTAYCVRAIPLYADLIDTFGPDNFQLALRAFEAGPYQRKCAESQIDPLGQTQLFWNVMVVGLSMLPTVSRSYGRSAKYFREETNRLFDVFANTTVDDGSQGLAFLEIQRPYVCSISLDRTARILRRISEETEEPFHDLLRASYLAGMRQRGLYSGLMTELIDFAKGSSNYRLAVLQYALLPAVSAGLLEDGFDIRVTGHRLIHNAGEIERGVEAVFKYGVSTAVATGSVQSAGDLYDALAELNGFGPYEDGFWQSFARVSDFTELPAEERSRLSHVPIFLVYGLSKMFGDQLSDLALDWDHLRRSKNSVRNFVAYLDTGDPGAVNLIERCQSAPGRELDLILRNATLLARHNQPFRLEPHETWEGIRGRIVDRARRLGATRIHLQQNEREALFGGGSATAERLLEILAGLTTHLAVDKDIKLLKDMARAHLSDWRSWRYDGKDAAGQLRDFSPVQLSTWKQNLIQPVIVEPETRKELRESLRLTMESLGLHITQGMAKRSPGFAVDYEYQQRVEKALRKLEIENGREILTGHDKRKLTWYRREALILKRYAFLLDAQGPDSSPIQVARAVGSLRQALKETKIRALKTAFGDLDYLERSFEREVGRGGGVMYVSERDDLVSLLDTEDAVRTCIPWSQHAEGTYSIMHFASDPIIKKLVLSYPQRLFSLSTSADRDQIEEVFRELFRENRLSPVDVSIDRSFNGWVTGRTADDKLVNWQLRYDSNGQLLRVYRSNVAKGGYLEAILRVSFEGGVAQVYGPGPSVVGRKYFRCLPTNRGLMVFADPAQPQDLTYERVLDVVAQDKAYALDIEPYRGRPVTVNYPESRHRLVYSPAIFGTDVIKQSDKDLQVQVTF